MRSVIAGGLVVFLAVTVSGCGWRGLNSLPLPGTAGSGPGSFEVKAQLPDVTNIQQNSRVRVADVTVGNVVKIEREGWHSLLTMRIDGNVELPANAVATIGQTSLLGSLHVELAPPTGVPPEGKLRNGSLIPLAAAGSYPTTEQTLAALSLVLNGGGIGQVQDITRAFSTAFAGRESDLRSLIEQLDQFMGRLSAQSDDIIRATESVNDLVGQFSDQRPVLDRALQTFPEALAVLKEQRENLVEVLDKLGKFSALTADTVDQTKEALIQELKDLGPVLKSLADAGPSLTRSLSFLTTFPWNKETIPNWFRGDFANLTLVLDLTLSRLDSSFLTGTRFEGGLTKLEMQWGRTIGQQPSPYTSVNPLTFPYQFDQGP
ncbi:MAG: phospholipid/cholesterol/gamma-HCH transport system substrate-binding protein [Mycobacterium sp.]|jgi:phospholipid/cholesterol/gamma-HCH transport system substrate-binding protein|nr:phospholipid/cholesterol/gamma-HCH transport system substrate-binding protein [Mycobacterium sp.]